MALDLVEQGDDYMVVRSTETGGLYAVVLDATKGVENLRAAPLAAWLSSGTVLGPGDVPAGRKPAATRSERHKPGEMVAVVERLLRENGPMTVREMADKGGIGAGSANSAVRVLLKKRKAAFTVEPREGNPHLNQNRYRLVEGDGDGAERTPAPQPRMTRSERDQRVLEIIQGADGPLSAQEINERLGLKRENTSTFETVNRLVESGAIQRGEREVVTPTPQGNSYGRPIRVYSYANEPSGPTESQRDSSESTQPV